MKPCDFIHVLENPDAPRLSSMDEQSELLRTVIVHVFYADEHIDDSEVALLERVLPDVDAREYLEAARNRELDLERIATLFPDPEDRDDIITLAEHAVWGDNRVDSSEWDIVDKLVETLGVERD